MTRKGSCHAGSAEDAPGSGTLGGGECASGATGDGSGQEGSGRACNNDASGGLLHGRRPSRKEARGAFP